MNRTRPGRSGRPSVLLAATAAVALIAAAAGPASRPTTGPTLTCTVDASASPDLQREGELLAAAAVGEYPRLCRELAEPGFVPIDHVTLKFKKISPGTPAYTTFASVNSTITLDIDWFHQHADDIGCVVHELTHVIQHYALRQPPSWITEGIADYTRWFVFEPAEKRTHPDPDTAHYDDAYRTTAQFLDWAQRKYNPDLVMKLNATCRDGHYREDVWQKLTGKPLDALGHEWELSLGGKHRVDLTMKVDTTAAPQCAAFAARAKKAGVKYYGQIARLLASPGFTPPTAVTLTIKPGAGVAATSGDDIECSAQYYAAHPSDVGSIIHELVHVVQAYHTGEQPGWLVEGIADYVRWFKWEPANGGKSPHADPATAKYDDSYQTSAEFLDWASKKYDRKLVPRLNEALRAGTYHDEIWKALTKHSVQELNDEWVQSLRAGH